MRIDLSNPVVRFLVSGADFTNGCSVIRNIILRALLALGGAVVIGVIASMSAAIVAGTLLYLFSPWYGQFNPDLSLSWLGPAWWADAVRAGAWLGTIVTAGGTAYGLWRLLKLIGSRQKMSIRTANLLSRTCNKLSDSSIAGAVRLTAGAVSTFAHKICPNVEVVVPPHIQAILDHPEKWTFKLWSSNYQYTFHVTEIEKRVSGFSVHLKLPENGRTDYITYYFEDASWNEDVEIEEKPL